LFISRDRLLPVRLGVDDLNDLKEKIIGIIVVALGMLFFGQAVSWYGKRESMYFGGTVAAVIAALSYFLKRKGKPSGAESAPEV